MAPHGFANTVPTNALAWEMVFNQRSFDSYGSTELMWFLTRQKKGASQGP
jgi:hypothetical protein